MRNRRQFFQTAAALGAAAAIPGIPVQPSSEVAASLLLYSGPPSGKSGPENDPPLCEGLISATYWVEGDPDPFTWTRNNDGTWTVSHRGKSQVVRSGDVTDLHAMTGDRLDVELWPSE